MPPASRSSPGPRIPKTADVVAANLRRQIIRGDLVDGDTLPAQHVLTEQYQVSRPILREAYRILESERLIEVRRGATGGARVRTPSADVAAIQVGLILQFGQTTLGDVHAARTALEAPAAATVAGDHADEGLALLRTCLARETAAMNDSGLDQQSKVSIAREFHAAIVALGGNNTLTLIDSILGTLVDQIGNSAAAKHAAAQTPTSVDACYRSHQRIYDLIAGGEVTAADQLWRRHLDAVTASMAGSAVDAVIDLCDRPL